MAPRKKVTAILSCDPSWRGLAFILFVPSLGIKKSFLYDLKDLDSSKQYKHPKKTVHSLNKVIDRIFEEPEITLLDKLVIEGQYRPNMQILTYLIAASFAARVKNIDIEYISPLTCKRNFDIALTGTHAGNKAAAVEFVENSENSLVASETVTDHNTADACLVLNTYLQTTKNKLLENLDDWSCMSADIGTKLVCPRCKNNSGVVRKCLDDKKPMYNKHFLTCWWENNKGTPEAKKCGNYVPLYANVPRIVGGFVNKDWKVIGGEADNGEAESLPKAGVKRSDSGSPNREQPDNKRPRIEPPSIPSGAATQAQIVGALKKTVEHLSTLLQQNTNDILMAFKDLDVRISNIEFDVNYIKKAIEASQGQSSSQDLTTDSDPTVPMEPEVKVIPHIDINDLDDLTF